MKALTLAFQDDPRFAELKKHRDESGGIHHVWGMDRRITPLLMEALSDTKRFRLIVTYEERRAREIVEDYRFYSRQTFYYPAKDALFYSADIHSNNTVQERLEIFKKIAEGRPCTVVTTIEGLMDKIPSISHIIENILTIKVGDTLQLDTNAISPSPPPPTAPAIAEYPRIVPIAIVAPVIREVLASTSNTLKMILLLLAPIAFAASITP